MLKKRRRKRKREENKNKVAKIIKKREV